MSQVQARLEQLQGELGGCNAALVVQVDDENPGQCRLLFPDSLQVQKCQCCCLAHCHVTFHNIYGSKAHHVEPGVSVGFEMSVQVDSMFKEQETSLEEETVVETDNITALIMSVGADLS